MHDLVEAGCRCVVLDNLSLGHREAVPESAEFIKGDFGDTDVLERIFSEYGIDAVMHFAGYSLVGESVCMPEKYYQNNVRNKLVLLRTMRDYGVRKVIFSSSCSIYGEPQTETLSENHSLNPASPYASTKALIEKSLSEYDAEHDFKYVSLRYFNAAGAHENAQIGESHDPETHLIPLVLKTAKGEQESISLFGTDYNTPDGTGVRDYTHVSDISSAHAKALEYVMNGGASQIYNVGTGTGYSVKEIIATAEAVTGKRIPVTISDRRSGDGSRLVADSSKIQKELGWKPKYSDIRDIIKTAWEWERNKRF